MPATIQIDANELRPIVELVVREILGHLDWPAGRLALSEEEAARAMGVPRHTLRDARLARELNGRRVGKRIVYTRQDLLDYLDRRQNSRQR